MAEAERFARDYGVADRDAAAETGLPLDRFATQPPLGVDEVEPRDFWPASALASLQSGGDRAPDA